MATLPMYNTGGASTTTQIPIYEASPELKSSAQGAEAAGQAAKRVGYLTREGGEAAKGGFEAFGQATTRITHEQDRIAGNKELTQGEEKFSEAVASMHDQYDKMRMSLTDPNEITQLQDQFRQKFKDSGADFVGSMKTDFAREHFEAKVRSHYDVFLNQMRSDNAEFAGIAAKTSVEKMAVNYGSMVFSNPSMLPWALGDLKDSIGKQYDRMPEGASPRTLAAKEELIQGTAEHIVKSAIEGVIRKGGNPTALMQKYGQYIKNPDEFISKFEAEKRAERGDLFLQRTMAKDAREEAQRVAEYGYRDQIHLKQDGTYDIPEGLLERARHDPRMGQGGFDALENHVWRLQMEGGKNANMQTYNSYAEAAISGALNDAGILKAESNPDANQRISHEQATELRNFISGPAKFTEADKVAFDALKTKLTQDLHMRDSPLPSETLAYQKMINAALNNWAVGIKAGKDRGALLTEGSPDYVLRGMDPKQFMPRAGTDALDSASIGAVLKQRQDQLGSVADQALKIIDVVKALGPEAAAKTLHEHGYNIDVTSDRWCAQLVNAALEDNGIKGTGSALASSFQNWGSEVSPHQAQKGDVFFASPHTPGYTGHVGIVTGPPEERSGNRLMLPVVSSQINSGYVNADSVIVRRAKPPVGDFFKADAPQTKKDFWERAFPPRSEPQGEIE